MLEMTAFILAPKTGEVCPITGLTRAGYMRHVEPQSSIRKTWVGRKMFVNKGDLLAWMAAGGTGRLTRTKKKAK